MTEGGRLVKMDVDYSVTCDELIPECKKMAAEGKIHDALDKLLALEKQTRTVINNLFMIDNTMELLNKILMQYTI